MEAAGGGSKEYWGNPHILKDTVDFPGDPMVKNLPASAGVTGSISGPGNKIPQATWLGQKAPKYTKPKTVSY